LNTATFFLSPVFWTICLRGLTERAFCLHSTWRLRQLAHTSGLVTIVWVPSQLSTTFTFRYYTSDCTEVYFSQNLLALHVPQYTELCAQHYCHAVFTSNRSQITQHAYLNFFLTGGMDVALVIVIVIFLDLGSKTNYHCNSLALSYVSFLHFH
jgi:hypothetical protein